MKNERSEEYSILKATSVYDCSCDLGEGPLWDPHKKQLHWIDINAQLIHTLNPKTGAHTSFKLPDLVTAIALRKSPGLLAVLRKKIVLLDENNHIQKTLYEVDPENSMMRFNDGKCDHTGRLWVGTIHTSDPTSASCMLYQGTMQGIKPVLKEIVFSNGLCWSQDHKTFFHIETFRRSIFAYDFDEKLGSFKNKRLFASIPEEDGMPDGMTIDTENGIWCACYGGSKVVRFNAEGKVSLEVLLPVPHITCCAFGGDDLRTLYITTARENLSEEDLKKYPLSGNLFAVKVNYRGNSETPFNDT